jgi:hypothetical protein
VEVAVVLGLSGDERAQSDGDESDEGLAVRVRSDGDNQ